MGSVVWSSVTGEIHAVIGALIHIYLVKEPRSVSNSDNSPLSMVTISPPR